MALSPCFGGAQELLVLTSGAAAAVAPHRHLTVIFNSAGSARKERFTLVGPDVIVHIAAIRKARTTSSSIL